MWGVGIECSTLPHLDVDQFEWTQHSRFWRDDLLVVREELGLTHLRYSIPWHYVEPESGCFDWSWADERISACDDFGLDLMLDIMHFGTPRWLTLAVGDPQFPEALERLTRAMVERYAGSVRTWCPVNEPLVTSLFSGDFGFWPPHSRHWRGYMPVLSRVALATSRSIRAIRSVQPEAQVVVCDAADHFTTRDESLQPEVALRNLRRFLLLDLMGGRVDSHHPLYEWVSAYGMSDLDLQWLRSNTQMPDIIGLDYYPHSDWQLEAGPAGMRQRRADAPIGLYGVAQQYFQRYGLPLSVTETSVEGKPINREIWLERMVEDIRQLRSEGVPMVGLTWWPLFDHLDWDGALTHRIGKLHEVGLYKLVREKDGVLSRVRTPLAALYTEFAARGNEPVGDLERLAQPLTAVDEQPSPLADLFVARRDQAAIGSATTLSNGNASQQINGHSAAPGRRPTSGRRTGAYGIAVFSHLRWGFVWQRPQQFLSRFAKKHPILFIEEPMFDLPDDTEGRIDLHQVMPNVTVACPHCPPSWQERKDLPAALRAWTRQAMEDINHTGAFDRPLLWYYSPMDTAWSLGHIEHRGIVYDCMDELSQFTGAPRELIEHEARLLQHADVVFTGGYNLWVKKKQQHENAHFFGCGVEAEHFGRAMDETTAIPPDVDFLNRPIIGWFGVIDERVDYALVGDMARLRPDWSFAMVGPVVKIDPALLPCYPNLYWLGGREYEVLPNYCRAFDACMMCFALNDSTEFINPTKALEYLATGRPVVSTPVRDVVRQYSDLMDIASTPGDFVAALERNLTAPDRDRIERGLAKARACSWEETVKAMHEIIRSAVADRDGKERLPIDPLPDERISRPYVSTPGS